MLALVTDAFGGRGGIAQAARDVIHALSADRSIDSITVLPRQATDRDTPICSKVIQLPPSKSRLIYSLRAVLNILHRPNIIFCNHLYIAPLAAMLKVVTRARLAVQVHGIEVWTKPSAFQAWALRHAEVVLCVSRNTRAHVLKLFDIEAERAVVLNNTFASQFVVGDRAASRRRYAEQEEIVLLTVGRLESTERYKGHDRVIEALASLPKDLRKRVAYLIAGDGGDRARLEDIVRRAGLLDRVRFLGQVPPEDLPDVYRAADLFLLPSTGEGFGIAFLEAMACGTPVLGIAAGGTPDALGDGILGDLVEANADLKKVLMSVLRGQKHDPVEISARATDHFGRRKFECQLAGIVQRFLT